MDWMQLIELLIGFIAGGGIVKLATIKSSKRKGDAEADSAVVKVLNDAITTMSNLDEGKDREIADLKAESRQKSETIAKLRQELADKRCENTTKGYYMCVHQGCMLRRPTLGRGKEYYDQHNKETDFGADFTPVEQLIKECKAQMREELKNE